MRLNQFICFTLLVVFSFSTSAKTIESTEYKYYEISPRTASEIKPELMRQSPIRAGSGSFNGHTDWYINWNYRSTQTPYGCTATQIQTKVHVIHTLPALSQFVNDQQTIEVFNKFNDALTLHEKNHGNHGLLAAREINQALSEMQPQRNCRSLSRLIDDIGNSIVRKYAHADNEYDHETQNGFTEGAVIY